QGILSSDGEDHFFPNVAVDSTGDLTIGYAFSSAATFAGVHYTGRLASDPPGTLEAPDSTLKAGETNVNGTRWGDYAGEVVDLDGCTVWHLEEYARSGSLWGTWIGTFRFNTCSAPADFSVAASPVSQTVNAGNATSYSMTL